MGYLDRILTIAQKNTEIYTHGGEYMKKGLRKILIGSAALFLLITLVAPGIAATSVESFASAGATNTDSASYQQPSTQPSAPVTVPMTQEPGRESEPEIEETSEPQSESDPMEEIEPPTEEAEAEGEPEEILPDIPSRDTDPDEPDSSYPSFEKERGKSYGRCHGNSKKVK